MSPADRQRIVFEWNRTEGDYPADECLADAFARHALLTPNAPAVVTADRTFTYRQILDRANRLTHYLRSRGVQPGDLVGVCLKRSADMIAAVIAVTRAGAAYVPLDPGYPKERLAFMLEDTKAPLVLTQWSLLDRLPADPSRLVNLDQIESELAALPNTESERHAGSDSVAYVIYTSGSTGKPKGVVVRHRAAINTIDWVNRTFGIGPKDRLLFVTSLSFDLSVYDIFGILGAGGCLRIADESEVKDPSRLAELLQTDGITIWDSAPAALQQLVPFMKSPSSWDELGSRRELRLVLLSGDWIPVTLPDQVRRSFPVARIVALGGATEASIWSNWFPVEDIDPTWTSIPYGKPIRNARYYILDQSLEPVPVGQSGELHIGGVCLADGYLNRADLTAERFIPDPFRSGERLYKTGDLARYLPDGNIEFLGRIDHQVKVRGFRVEIGEIESALVQHAAVREAVVKPFRDADGNVSLVAFIVRKSTVDAAALGRHLRSLLPEYMVPSTIAFLESLPITPNGKVDRATLEMPATPAPTGDYQPPKNDAEQALQPIWEETLNVHPVSVTAHFEDLGGHSLLAAQLVARIETRLGHKIPVETLFQASTVRDLAAVIQRRLELGGGTLVPLNEEGTQPPLFLIAGAGGHVFTFHKFARLLGGDFPSYGMKAIGVDGTEPPPDRVEVIAARYLDEILKARPKGPYVLAGYSVGGLMAFELGLQMQRRGLEVARIIVFDTLAPGYPRPWPWPVRMGIHFLNLMSLSGERKWKYLGERFRNTRHRILTTLGLGHVDLQHEPNVGGLSDRVLKRVWAALERAWHRYRPTEKFKGQIVLIRSEHVEHWAATRLDDPLKGWARWSTQPVQAIGVPVGHMEIFSEANLDLMVTEMRKLIPLKTEDRKQRTEDRKQKTEVSAY